MDSRSRTIKRKFRVVTETVCTFDNDDPENWIQNQEFADDLWDLFHLDMPDSWRRHLRLRDPSPRGRRRRRPPSVKATKNRTILNLRNNLATKKLEAVTIETIWKWADDPASFLAETNRRANAIPDGAAVPAKPLDSVCILLSHLETQGQVDRVRQRLLLCFLAWVVNEKIHAVGTQDDVATLLVQSQLISEASQECVKKFLNEWLSKGKQYLYLAGQLGGVGAIIFLPLWGESNWYHHSHAGRGNDVDELVALLKARGVTRDASLARHDGRNAYDVVDTLFQALRNRSGHCFVPYEATSPSPQAAPLGKRYRRSRRPSRRELSPVGSSSPPTVGQQAAHEWSPHLSVDFGLFSSTDAPGIHTPAMIYSPSVTLPHDDDCRILRLSTLPTL